MGPVVGFGADLAIGHTPGGKILNGMTSVTNDSRGNLGHTYMCPTGSFAEFKWRSNGHREDSLHHPFTGHLVDMM